jgi:hypothetical protein
MIVVADSGPLHYLILLDHAGLLERFYRDVLLHGPRTSAGGFRPMAETVNADGSVPSSFVLIAGSA